MRTSTRPSSRFLLTAFIATVLLASPGCPPSGSCTRGLSVLLLNDSEVPGSVKTAIYASGAIVGTDDADFPSEPRIVVIPYETTNFPYNPEVTNARIEEDFFGVGSGSIRDYFSEVSYGQFDITSGGISSVVSLSDTTTSFGVGQEGGDWTRNPELHRQICQFSSIDWSDLDTNNDRVITANEAQVCFMVSIGLGGAERGSAPTVTTNQGEYTISQRFVFFDCRPESDPRDPAQNIRYNFATIIHELSHGFFSLPDRYTSYCGTGGTGRFDIMSDSCAGTQHLTMVDKIKIGWVRPKILPQIGLSGRPPVQCYSFPASESVPAALVLVNTTKPGEYWVVENRNAASSPGGFEAGLPESGLCIWHVKAGTGGADDTVHLVNASMPDQNPTNYVDAGPGALFRQRGSTPVGTHTLYYSNGQAGPFIFGRVSPAGATMFAEF